jgi:hypothetical protein
MAIWMRLPSILPLNVTMYRPSGFWKFLDVAGHPIADERRLENLDYNSMPTDLIAGRSQDRRVKDNVLIEGSYRSRKIASFQRGCEDPLCQCGDSWAGDGVKRDSVSIGARSLSSC